MTRRFGITLILIIAFFACKKSNNGTTIYPINQDLKKYYYYRPDSYWIYKDSLSGRIDSFIVVSNDSGTAYGGNTRIIFTNRDEQFVNIVIYDYNISNPGTIINQWKLTLLDYAAILNMPDFYYPLFFYPFSYNHQQTFCTDLIINGCDKYFVENKSQYSTINGNVYSNVIGFGHYDTSKTSSSIYNDHYYINDSIGIIKMKLYHPNDSINFIWELQRCNIVR